MASDYTDFLPVVVEYIDGKFLPKHRIDIEEGWTGQILVKSDDQGEPNLLQKESLKALISDIEQMDRNILSFEPGQKVFQRFSFLFVDLSAWIAFIEPEH